MERALKAVLVALFGTARCLALREDLVFVKSECDARAEEDVVFFFLGGAMTTTTTTTEQAEIEGEDEDATLLLGVRGVPGTLAPTPTQNFKTAAVRATSALHIGTEGHRYVLPSRYHCYNTPVYTIHPLS